jgi:hypothetical protein
MGPLDCRVTAPERLSLRLRGGGKMLQLAPYEADMKTLHFLSPLGHDECLRRLQLDVGPDRWRVWIVGGAVHVCEADRINWDKTKRAVVGAIGSDGFRLRKWIPGYNSFQTLLWGRIERRGSGTIVHCRLGMRWSVWAVMALSLAVACFIAGKAWMLNTGTRTSWLAFAAILCGSIAIFALGRYQARDEGSFLVDFLRRTLDLRDDEHAS